MVSLDPVASFFLRLNLFGVRENLHLHVAMERYLTMRTDAEFLQLRESARLFLEYIDRAIQRGT